MVKIAATFRDPRSAAKLDCDALALAAATPGPLPEFLDGLTIGTHLPKKPNDEAPRGRLLVVQSGPWLTYQPSITATQRLRFVAFAPARDDAWDIASWFHARLLAFPGDEDVQAYRYDAAPEDGIDPDYDTPIAAFTIGARMRPAIL